MKISLRSNSNGQWKNGRLHVTPTVRGQDWGKAGTVDMVEGGPLTVSGTGQNSPVMPVKPAEVPQRNDDPHRRRIHHQPPRNWFKRIIWKLSYKPDPTPEEIQRAEEIERRKHMETLLRDEAELYRSRIVNRLNGRELCYRYKKTERDFLTSGVQSVKFDRIVLQPDAIYYRINTMRLPRGLGILDLMGDDVLTDLSLVCQHRVSGDYSEKYGAWYIVERSTGVLGIPNHVKYQDMIASIPASADGLSIPIGFTSNARPVYKSLSVMYSMLIGGTIGSGKSNILNVILCTLIRRNPPDRLKLILVDLKGGLEFSFYEGIPHLLEIEDFAPGGIAYYRDHVPGVLTWLHREGERRIQVIKNAGYKDIGRYNQHQRKKALPHIVFVIDEWADVKLEAKIGRHSEDILTNIAQRFRAVGIHVILCTQVPKSEIVSTRIKGVLPAKLAFSCPTNQGSMAIIDNGHARGLEPAGRCVFQWGEEVFVQAPYINERIIHDTVNGAITGTFEKVDQGHDVLPLEIQKWSLEHDNGYLSRRRLHHEFGKRGLTQQELEDWLASWEGTEIVVGTSLYRVDPAAGSRPRRMISVDVEGGDDDKTS